MTLASHATNNWLNSEGHFVGLTNNRINWLLFVASPCWDSVGDVVSLSPESCGWSVLTGCCEGDFHVLSEYKIFVLTDLKIT